MSEEKDQFASLGLTRQFINALEDKGYEKATLIQEKGTKILSLTPFSSLYCLIDG